MFRRNQLLRTVFNRYTVFYPTIHRRDPSATRHINNKQQNAAADAYRAPSRTMNHPQRKQLLRTTFHRYVLNDPTIRSRDPFSTLHINNKQQNAISDMYGAFPSAPNSLPSSFPRHNGDDDD